MLFPYWYLLHFFFFNDSFQDSGVIYFSNLKIKTAKCPDFFSSYDEDDMEAVPLSLGKLL